MEPHHADIALQIGTRLFDQYEPDGTVCDAERIVAALWTVPRVELADEFSIGETDRREPGDVRAHGETLVAPEMFHYAVFENEPASVAHDPAVRPTVAVTQDDADVADALERAGNRPDLGLEDDPAMYLGVTVETGGQVHGAGGGSARWPAQPVAPERRVHRGSRPPSNDAPRAAGSPRRHAVVVGFGEGADESDQVVALD